MRTLPLLVSMLCASVALAEPPAPATGAVTDLVNKQLLAPLKKAESRRSRFSRAAPVAVERRLRVLDAVALTDRRGKQFFRFAIDQRRPWHEPDVWENDSFAGCAYPSERQVFVRQGDAYLPARNRLGANEKADPDACRPVPRKAVQIASTELGAPTPARIP